MSIHTLVLTIIAALAPPDGPKDLDDQQPDVTVIEDQFFCCEWVDPNGNGGRGMGGGCVKISEDNVNGCLHWLSCPGGATGSEGTVTCTAPKDEQ